MAALLEAAEHHQRQKVTTVQAGSGRVETSVDALRLDQQFFERLRLGTLMNQATPGKFIKYVYFAHGFFMG